MLGRVKWRGKVSTREDLRYQTDSTGNASLVILGPEELLSNMSESVFVQSAGLDMKARA